LKEHAWKACVGEILPWVRIPPSPPLPLFSCIYSLWCLLRFLLCIDFGPSIGGKGACRHVQEQRFYGGENRVNILKKVKVGKSRNLCLWDKEMLHLTWRDVDFRTHVIRVTRKPLYGFEPKNKEEREVPVPASLIAALKKYKASKKPNVEGLVFPNESGQTGDTNSNSSASPTRRN
jgi:hypothetical protein